MYQLYMFRHQVAIFRELIKSKASYVQLILQVLVAHTSVIKIKNS